jgi:hypothetical protein
VLIEVELEELGFEHSVGWTVVSQPVQQWLDELMRHQQVLGQDATCAALGLKAITSCNQ